jgi:hypothetical protein
VTLPRRPGTWALAHEPAPVVRIARLPRPGMGPARDTASQHALSLRLLGPDAYRAELRAMHEDFRRALGRPPLEGLSGAAPPASASAIARPMPRVATVTGGTHPVRSSPGPTDQRSTTIPRAMKGHLRGSAELALDAD